MRQSRPRFDECLAVILQAWQHEVFSHQGQFFQYEQHSVTPRPVQQPYPPIYVACVMSPESYEWAGAHGHHILTAPFFFTRFQDQQTRLTLYLRALEKVGLDPASRDVVGAYHLYCGDGDTEVRAIAEPGLRAYQAFAKAADLLRGAQRDPEQYQAWRGFFENRETIRITGIFAPPLWPRALRRPRQRPRLTPGSCVPPSAPRQLRRSGP
jgi:alkanesulfonate monooxygenase SsuD/methylene tetrahydromethanopterin reductase-like flavin-dependent oxidoreductase (luciferase family)